MINYLAIAEITKPQGVRGELKLRPMTGDPERFDALKLAYLRQGDIYTPVDLRFVRRDEDAVYIRIEGVVDRNAAEKLRGQLLYVDRARAIELDKDEYFIADLEGLEGVDTEGNSLGALREVLQPGGNDVYVFIDKQRRREALVPAVKSVVVSIDPEGGRIVLDAARLKETAVVNDL